MRVQGCSADLGMQCGYGGAEMVGRDGGAGMWCGYEGAEMGCRDTV